MTPEQFLKEIITSELMSVRIAAKRAKNSVFRAVAVEREAHLEKELEQVEKTLKSQSKKREPVTA